MITAILINALRQTSQGFCPTGSCAEFLPGTCLVTSAVLAAFAKSKPSCCCMDRIARLEAHLRPIDQPQVSESQRLKSLQAVRNPLFDPTLSELAPSTFW